MFLRSFIVFNDKINVNIIYYLYLYVLTQIQLSYKNNYYIINLQNNNNKK